MFKLTYYSELRYTVSPKELEIIEKMEEILKGEKIRLPSLRFIDRSKLRDAVRMVNAVSGKIITMDVVTLTNDLIYAGAVIMNEIMGVQRIINCANRQPWRKRRLEHQVSDLTKDLGRVNAMIQGRKIKKKYTYDLQNRYKIKQKELGVAKEEIKQRITAKTAKIKRYSDGISQYINKKECSKITRSNSIIMLTVVKRKKTTRHLNQSKQWNCCLQFGARR